MAPLLTLTASSRQGPMGSFSSSISSMGRIHSPLTAANTSPSPLYYRQTKAKNNAMCTNHSSNIDNSEDDNTKRSSSRSQSDSSLPSCTLPAIPSFEELQRRRSGHEETWVKPKRRISFNDHVSVREFECNSSPITSARTLEVPKFIVCPTEGSDDENFDKFFPVIFPHDPLVMPPRSTSNIKGHGILRRSTDPGIVRRSAGPSGALSIHGKGTSSPFGLNTLLRQEIRRILMVDPHDIFLALFSKRLQQALPHVTIVTAHSSEEALQVLQQPQQKPFDIIITEERLSLFHRHSTLQFNSLANTSSSIMSPAMDGKPQVPAPASGSALIGHLKQHYSQQSQHSLLIGVSAHWPSDHLTMQQSGADYCWSKAPPPTFHQNLLEELLHTLLLKRGKHDLAKALMVASSAEDAILSASPIQMDRKQ